MIKKGCCIVRLIPLLFLILFFGHVRAQTEKKKIFQYLKIELGLGTIYNDNILRYSDYYLTKFLNNEDEGRFHINTSDGMVLDQSINIASTFLFFGKNKTILEGGYTRQSYINNKIKTWNQIDFNLKQYITNRLVINLSYSYLPRFYVRHYRDDDWVDVYGYVPETFQPFIFAKNDYGLWAQYSFFKNKKTRLRLSFDYENYFYNKHFTEYDSKNQNYAINFYQSVKEILKFEAGYQFVISKAKGFDEIQETRDNSNDSDASYKADEYSCAINWTLPNLLRKPNNINVDFEYRRTCFSSKHYLEIDRMHAGRIDNFYKIGINYEIKLLRPLSISGFYRWCKQDSDTRAEANKEFISQEKDFTQQQFGLKFTYKFRDIKFSRSNSRKTKK